MIGAALTHLRRGEYPNIIVNIVLIVLIVIVEITTTIGYDKFHNEIGTEINRLRQ